MSDVRQSLDLEREEWTVSFPARLPAAKGDWVNDCTYADAARIARGGA